MIDLLIAAALAQASVPMSDRGAPDPCNVAGQPETPRPGCPAWQFTDQDEKTRRFIDPASVRTEGNIIRIDHRSVYAQARGVSRMRSIITTMRVDCVQQTLIAEYVRSFDADGYLLASVSTPDAELHPIEPSSSAATWAAEYCPHRTSAR